jgi:putative ABC transport system substrate-binding protein
MSNFSPELSGKRLELLKESAPKTASVAVLWNCMSPGHPQVLKETEAADRSLGITLKRMEVRNVDDVGGAL